MPASRRAVNAWLACAGLAAARATPAAGTVVEITIKDYRFDPAHLSVGVGTTVRWVNAERRTAHSVLFLGPDGFESERFFPGEAWQRTFDRAGRYPYSCGPHPEMKGLVEVTP